VAFIIITDGDCDGYNADLKAATETTASEGNDQS
jgi:hypothetical protein